jgi:hypothetical protein
MPVFVAVSQATLESGSSARHASSYIQHQSILVSSGGLNTIASETWSQILSGCPSPTDSKDPVSGQYPKTSGTRGKKECFTSGDHC